MLPKTNPSHCGRQSGFTLFEMLVAVALFAVMAVLAYGGLDRVIAARNAVETEASRWRDLEALFTRMQSDLDGALPRAVRNEFGVTEPAFKGDQVLVGQDAANLWLVTARGKGAPQRIGYRLLDSRLELLQWDVLDQPPRARPKVSLLWKGLKAFDIRYLDNGSWMPTWPSGRASFTDMPRAIEVSVTLDDGLNVKRVLLLP